MNLISAFSDKPMCFLSRSNAASKLKVSKLIYDF